MTQERLQLATLDEKKVDQLKNDRATIGASLAFLRQQRDRNAVRQELQDKRNEEMSCEPRRSASEDTRSYIQEESQKKTLRSELLEWLFRYHRCTEPENAHKYFQLFSMQIKDKDNEYTMNLCNKYFFQTEEGQANCSNQSMK